MNEDKIVEALLKAERFMWKVFRVLRASLLLTMLGALIYALIACPRAKAAPLISDGDETASIGTARVITPHPSWAAPIGGTSWISISQTGWPLATYIPNGTVISFSEVFSLTSMPSSALVTWAADDSSGLYINGSLVVAEASMAGNAYTTCSDFGVTCTSHSVADILPWLAIGANEIRFDVAQRGGYSFGLNYAISLTYINEPPLVTPEPWTLGITMLIILVLVITKYDRR